MRKLISLIVSLAVLFGTVCVAPTAFAATVSGFVSTSSVGDMPLFGSSITSSVKKTKDGKTYYGEGRELYEQIRSALDKRSGSVTFRYYNKKGFAYSASFSTQIRRMVGYAWSDEMSVTSTDGDYAHWNVSGLSYDAKAEKDSNGYYYTVTLKIGYYNTTAQEKSVDNAVSAIVDKVRKNNMSDYDAMRYIHDYICDRTRYSDYAMADPESEPTAFTAYGALIGGSSVCQGYSLAFYRICRELGYKVRFVYSDPNRGCHAWNMVQLDGRYYFIDCTWDDDIADNKSEQMQSIFGGNKYYYFLVDYDKLRSQDRAMTKLQAHYIDNDLTDDDYFVTNYYNNLADSSYNYNDSGRLSACTVSLAYYTTAYTGTALKPSVSVTDRYGNPMKSGRDYTVTYSSNVNCGTADVVVKGVGDYVGATCVRRFNILPPKMTAPSYSSGRTASAITIKWGKCGGSVSGYQVQMYKGGKWTVIKNVSSSVTTCNVTGLGANQKCRFRVRAYRIISRSDKYGTPSAVYTTYTTPKVPTVALSTKSKSITVKWKKVSCTGYEVQYADNKSMKNARTVRASASSVSKTIKSLKRGRRYYVRVRAYRNVTSGGKTLTYRSAWCAKKSITVK